MAITNFLDGYEIYSKNTIAIPPLFHKWAAITAIAATLGRRIWIERGHFKVVPNLYVLLMGEPGTGKGTACSLMQDILIESGYEYFSADRSSKEMFLQDLADGITFNRKSVEDFLGQQNYEGINGKESGSIAGEPRECFIIAEELQDFLGQNNLDFIAFLTKIWSHFGPPYRYRLKTGRSVSITDPCINLLGGITSSNFALTFPPDIVSQGFLARLILVSGEGSGKRISFPPIPENLLKLELSSFLAEIRRNCCGAIDLPRNVMCGLDELNQEFGGVDDPRFKDYNIRRFSQLLKLCIIHAASRMDRQLSITDIERSDEILRETERWMPKALGSFGKAKNADVTNKILQLLYSAEKPVTIKELWRATCDDLEKFSDLGDLLQKLSISDRIQSHSGGWLAKIRIPLEVVKKIGEKKL